MDDGSYRSWFLCDPFRVGMLMNSGPGAARYTLAPGYCLLPLQGNDKRFFGCCSLMVES